MVTVSWLNFIKNLKNKNNVLKDTFVHTNVRNCEMAHLYRDMIQNVKRVLSWKLGYASFEGFQILIENS
jgi:hypothetical protein